MRISLEEIKQKSGMYVLNEDGTLYRDASGKAVKVSENAIAPEGYDYVSRDGVTYIVEDGSDLTDDNNGNDALTRVKEGTAKKRAAITKTITDAEYSGVISETCSKVGTCKEHKQFVVLQNNPEAQAKFISKHMGTASAAAVGCFFEYLLQQDIPFASNPELCEWLSYTYDEILLMNVNGTYVPDEVLEWANEEAQIYGMPEGLEEETPEIAEGSQTTSADMEEYLNDLESECQVDGDGELDVTKTEEEVSAEVENDPETQEKASEVSSEETGKDLDQGQLEEYELTSEELIPRIIEAGEKSEKMGEEALKEVEEANKEVESLASQREAAVGAAQEKQQSEVEKGENPEELGSVEEDSEVANIDAQLETKSKKGLKGIDKLKRFKQINKDYTKFLDNSENTMAIHSAFGTDALAGGIALNVFGAVNIQVGTTMVVAGSALLAAAPGALFGSFVLTAVGMAMIEAGCEKITEGSLEVAAGTIFSTLGLSMITLSNIGMTEIDKSEDKIDVSEEKIDDSIAQLKGEKVTEKSAAHKELMAMKEDGASLLKQTAVFGAKSVAETAKTVGKDFELLQMQMILPQEEENSEGAATHAVIVTEVLNKLIEKIQKEVEKEVEKLAKEQEEQNELLEKKENYEEKVEDNKQLEKMGIEPQAIPSGEEFTDDDNAKLQETTQNISNINEKIGSLNQQITDYQQKIIDVGTEAQTKIGESYQVVDEIEKYLATSGISGQSAIDYGTIAQELGIELSAKSAKMGVLGFLGIAVGLGASASGVIAIQAGKDLNVIFDDTQVKTSKTLVSITGDQIEVQQVTTVGATTSSQEEGGEEQTSESEGGSLRSAEVTGEEDGEETSEETTESEPGSVMASVAPSALGVLGNLGEDGEETSNGETTKEVKETAQKVAGMEVKTTENDGSKSDGSKSGSSSGLATGVSTSMSASEAMQKGKESQKEGKSGQETAKNAISEGKKADAETKQITSDSEKSTKEIEKEYKEVTRSMKKDLKTVEKLKKESAAAIARQAAIGAEMETLSSENEKAMATISASQSSSANAPATSATGAGEKSQGGLLGSGNGLLAQTGAAQTGETLTASSTITVNQGKMEMLSQESTQLTSKVSKNTRKCIKLNANAMKKNRKLQKLTKEKTKIQKTQERAEKAKQEKIQKDMAVIDMVSQVFSIISSVGMILGIIAKALAAIPFANLASPALETAAGILSTIGSYGTILCTLAKGTYLLCQGDITQGLMQLAMGIVQAVMAAVGAASAAGAITGPATEAAGKVTEAVSKGAEIAQKVSQGFQVVSNVAGIASAGANIANDASIIQGKGPNKAAMMASQIAGFIGAAASLGGGIAGGVGDLSKAKDGLKKVTDVTTEAGKKAAKVVQIAQAQLAGTVISSAGALMSSSAALADYANGGKQTKGSKIASAIGSSLSLAGGLVTMGAGIAETANQEVKDTNGETVKKDGKVLLQKDTAQGKAQIASSVIGAVGNLSSGIGSIISNAGGDEKAAKVMTAVGGGLSTSSALMNTGIQLGTYINNKKDAELQNYKDWKKANKSEGTPATPSDSADQQSETTSVAALSKDEKAALRAEMKTNKEYTSSVGNGAGKKNAKADATMAKDIIGQAGKAISGIGSIISGAGGDNKTTKIMTAIGSSLSGVSSIMNVGIELDTSIKNKKAEDSKKVEAMQNTNNGNSTTSTTTGQENGNVVTGAESSDKTNTAKDPSKPSNEPQGSGTSASVPAESSNPTSPESVDNSGNNSSAESKVTAPAPAESNNSSSTQNGNNSGSSVSAESKTTVNPQNPATDIKNQVGMLNVELKKADVAAQHIRNSKLATEILNGIGQMTTAVAAIVSAVTSASGSKSSNAEKYLQLIGQAVSVASGIMNMSNQIAESVNKTKEELTEIKQEYANKNIILTDKEAKEIKKQKDLEAKEKDIISSTKYQEMKQAGKISMDDLKAMASNEAKKAVKAMENAERIKVAEDVAKIGNAIQQDAAVIANVITSLSSVSNNNSSVSKIKSYDFKNSRELLRRIEKRHNRRYSYRA